MGDLHVDTMPKFPSHKLVNFTVVPKTNGQVAINETQVWTFVECAYNFKLFFSQNGFTPLHEAAMGAKVQSIQNLIMKGVAINAVDIVSSLRTCVHYSNSDSKISVTLKITGVTFKFDCFKSLKVLPFCK